MTRKIFAAAIAAALIAFSTPSAQALTPEEVSAALIIRISEAEAGIADTQDDIADAATASEAAILQRLLRLQNGRLRQMTVFLRLIDRFPESRLLALVEYFDLPVSRS
ncbi:hypothetical protein [uncultured Pelagimonas sp.]|uniref:hypothetical protein n=1 Tax=uncultured Pelagimonas sp. TaxID=1618102 RepID=UPI00262519FB|nr:hypothetical protein [uncultured Pelagimonas sp.]